MNILSLFRSNELIRIGKALPPAKHWSGAPDWVQANEARIEKALARALARPSGGWLVLDASRVITDTPSKYTVRGREYVAWRADGVALVAPAACPHMGADLSCGSVDKGALVCPWHGLRLGKAGHGAWSPLPTHDDGVLVWACFEGVSRDGVPPTPGPILAPRPARALDAVIRMEAACEPADVIANRLDPWHGVHYHPHSFAKLDLLDINDDVITLRVAYRVTGRLCVEVDATFHSPEPNTITMTIVAGDGVGSVVETHATPISDSRTAVIEATLATTDRFVMGPLQRAGNFLRPFIEDRARRLWVEDAAYAERRYALRQQATSGTPTPKKTALSPKKNTPLPKAGNTHTKRAHTPRNS